MPALVPVIGVARVTVQASANGVPVVNVFHVRNGDVGAPRYSDAGAQSLADAFKTAWQTAIVSLTNISYTLDTFTVQDLTDDNGSFAQATSIQTGSGSGTSVPQSAACCVTWKIPRHYRGGHPRTYIGPISASSISTPTTLSGTFVSNVQSNMSTLRTTINALTIGGNVQQLVCVHRIRNGVNLEPPLVDKISGCTVDSRIDSMRRRLGPDR